jgi:hypothetical protein
MDQIRLIHDKTQLQGTCYFEFLPGEYKEQHWNDGSVFLAEDVFGLIEPIVARHEPRFDHLSFVGIRRRTWERIIADLERLAEQAERAADIGDLVGEIGFVHMTEAEFANHFRANADSLAGLARELTGWVREQLREHEYVSILGL